MKTTIKFNQNVIEINWIYIGCGEQGGFLADPKVCGSQLE